MEKLRELIRSILIERFLEEKEELLTEPDEAYGKEEEEVSSGGVAGVTVPLGVGPNFPNRTRRKKGVKSPLDSAASSFGNAKPVKSLKKK